MELAQYIHVVCFSSVRSTVIKVIKKYHFISQPGLTPTIISKHHSTSIAAAQVHLHQEIQTLQSTNTKANKKASVIDIRRHSNKLKTKKEPGKSLEDVLQAEIDEDCFSRSLSPNKQNIDVEYMVVYWKDLCIAYIDLIGWFPCDLSSRNEYILVTYHYGRNLIHGTSSKR